MDLTTKQKLLYNLYIKYKVAFLDNGIDEEIIKAEGSIYSKVAIISEAPQVTGKRAGAKEVTGLLNLIGVNKSDAYITSVVKFCPKIPSQKTGNTVTRPPSKNEIEQSAPFLFEELKIVEPRVAVTLGGNALKAVTGDHSIKLREFHGRILEISQLLVYPLYNPKSVNYIKELAEVYEKDISGLRELLRQID